MIFAHERSNHWKRPCPINRFMHSMNFGLAFMPLFCLGIPFLCISYYCTNYRHCARCYINIEFDFYYYAFVLYIPNAYFGIEKIIQKMIEILQIISVFIIAFDRSEWIQLMLSAFSLPKKYKNDIETHHTLRIFCLTSNGNNKYHKLSSLVSVFLFGIIINGIWRLEINLYWSEMDTNCFRIRYTHANNNKKKLMIWLHMCATFSYMM